MWPLIELAVEPKSPEDRTALVAALAQLAEADSSLSVSTDRESGLTILHGSDEAVLDRKLGILIHGHGIALNVGAPQVAYRETITRRAEIAYSHTKVRGEKGEFAHVKLVFEPGSRGSVLDFSSSAPPDAVPPSFLAGAVAGLEAARTLGLLAGFPVIEMKATLVNGAYHDRDSSPLTFFMAAQAAFKALRDKGGPVLLEPVMAVEISARPARLAAIVADLQAHRGAVAAQDGVVKGLVPLAGLLGYESRLRGLTEGLGAWSMVFDHYAPIPRATPPDDVFPPAMGMRA